jgi:hypothetical protein
MTEMRASVVGSSGPGEIRLPEETLGRRARMSWAAVADLAAMFAHYESDGLHGSAAVALCDSIQVHASS